MNCSTAMRRERTQGTSRNWLSRSSIGHIIASPGTLRLYRSLMPPLVAVNLEGSMGKVLIIVKKRA